MEGRVIVKMVESECSIIDRCGAFQCVYGCSNEKSENGDEEDGSEISGGRGGKVEIAWLLVCR